jgi:exosortase K
LLAAGTAAALKQYFSAADSSGLKWMLQPLALLLRLLTGWHFQQTPTGNWESHDAGIVLVQACAGMNFMIMSFVGWCWLLRPQRRITRLAEIVIEWPVLLLAGLLLAWVAALCVNTLRVVAIVAWQPALQRWIEPQQAHRLIGLLIYLPALTGQLMLSGRRCWYQAALIGPALYVALMLVVPVLTGNASMRVAQYREHALLVLALALPVTLLGLYWRWRQQHKPVRQRW